MGRDHLCAGLIKILLLYIFTVYLSRRIGWCMK
jgi:hypothetical protein